MKNFGGRLKKLRSDKGFSQDDLSKKIGKTRNTIHHYEAGRSEPNLSNLMHLCEILEVTPNDLILDQDTITQVNEPSGVYSTVTTNAERINLKANAGNGVESQEREELSKEYWPMLSEKTPRGMLWTIFQIEGDSMDETIGNGDFICCEKAAKFHDDMIYMIRFSDGTLSCKQVRKVRDRQDDHYGKLELLSHNRTYRPGYISKEEVKDMWRVYRIVKIKKM